MKTKLKKRSNINQKQRIIFTILVLIIPLTNFAVFTIWMNSKMFVDSFYRTVYNVFNGTSKRVFCGFDQYRILFKENLSDMSTGIEAKGLPFYLVKNTLIIIPVSILTMCISLVFSYAIARKFFGYGFFRIILYVPNILSIVIMATLFKILCNDNGLIGKLFINKVQGGLFGPQSVFKTMLIFTIWSGCVVNLYFMSAFARLPDSIFESAELDGASETVLFFRIAFPLVSSLFVTMLISSVCGAFTFFGPIFFFAPNNDRQMAHTLGYKLISFAQSSSAGDGIDSGLFSALGVTLTIIASFFAILTRWVGSKLAVEDIEY